MHTPCPVISMGRKKRMLLGDNSDVFFNIYLRQHSMKIDINITLPLIWYICELRESEMKSTAEPPRVMKIDLACGAVCLIVHHFSAIHIIQFWCIIQCRGIQSTDTPTGSWFWYTYCVSVMEAIMSCTAAYDTFGDRTWNQIGQYFSLAIKWIKLKVNYENRPNRLTGMTSRVATP